jgi:hypothetical protein
MFIGPKVVVDLNEDCQNQSGCSRLNLHKHCEACNMVSIVTEVSTACNKNNSILNCLAQKLYWLENIQPLYFWNWSQHCFHMTSNLSEQENYCRGPSAIFTVPGHPSLTPKVQGINFMYLTPLPIQIASRLSYVTLCTVPGKKLWPSASLFHSLCNWMWIKTLLQGQTTERVSSV